jgi:hypothetical protein
MWPTYLKRIPQNRSRAVQIGFTDPWWKAVDLHAAQAPFTFNMDQGWNWTDLVSLGLTAALVWIAYLEIKRAKRAETAALESRKGREGSSCYAHQC